MNIGDLVTPKKSFTSLINFREEFFVVLKVTRNSMKGIQTPSSTVKVLTNTGRIYKFYDWELVKV